jgi:IMP cyclohydrolase
MHMTNLIEMLKNNPYPGRGIFLGRAENGNTRLIYFIMGRSENSRNRIFKYTDDGIRTQVYDPEKLKDPSLIIYHPVRLYNGKVIVTNGDQTETVRDFLERGRTFREALMTREYEPDAPNYTPRISGIVAEDGSIELSILKSMEGSPDCCCRYFYNYDRPLPGTGYFISTYKGDGAVLPSFEGEPVYSAIPEEDEVWNALNPDNKVSLYCCELDKSGNIITQRIINKFNEQTAGKIVIKYY